MSGPILLDPAPLLAALELEIADRPRETYAGSGTARAMADALGGAVSARTIVRWRRGARLQLFTADRCAIALRTHPLILWPEFHRGD